MVHGALRDFPIERLGTLAEGRAIWRVEEDVNFPHLVSLFEGGLPTSPSPSAAPPSAIDLQMEEVGSQLVTGTRKRKPSVPGGRGPRLESDSPAGGARVRPDFFLVVPLSAEAPPSHGLGGGSSEGGVGGESVEVGVARVGEGGERAVGGGQGEVCLPISPSPSTLCQYARQMSAEWQQQAKRYLIVGEVKRLGKLSEQAR